jgi:ABC-type glycerol-3-phosphate transport system substrate-binding protein
MHGAYPEDTIPNVGVAQFPQVDASAPITATSSNDLEFIIPIVTDEQKDPDHQKLVTAFVKQLNSPESQQVLWEQGIFPIMTDVAEQPSTNAWADVLKAQIDLLQQTTYAVDENTYGPNTDEALTNGLQALLLENITVDELLESIQEANQKDFSCAPSC